MTEMLMRSLMFVPAHNVKLLLSASNSDADVLLLDIEDSVQPVINKQVARDNIIQWVGEGAFKNHLVFPRVNDRESGHLLKDLMQLTIPGVHGFMYPKSFTGEDIYFIDKLLDTIEYEKSFPQGTFKLIPLIETSSAVLHAEEICKASSRVVAIAYGSEDFISDLEGIHDEKHESLFIPRAMIAMAARANQVIPIDTVHEGMMVLNPKELPLVHEYFSPSKQEVEDAKQMLELSQLASLEGKGVAILNGRFIGPPMVRKARKILSKHLMIERKVYE
jgi:citrate lyase subunit beta/citryl-CoA lyase